MDLPGIYSLSPYSPEEVVSRTYLIAERPDVILNIVDASNLERNLYLTTQLLELGIPVVLALNMMDVVERGGDTIDVAALERKLGCRVVETSAIKGTGVEAAAAAAIAAAKAKEIPEVRPIFEGSVEHALAHIEERLLHDMPDAQQRFYSIKLFERDEKVLEEMQLSQEDRAHIEEDIVSCEEELGDDSEAIIVGQRYTYIETIAAACCTKRLGHSLNISQKIDRVVTHRILALPIFVAVITLVYYLSVSTVGGWATDWANDGLFGEGYFLFGRGSGAYTSVAEDYEEAQLKAEQFLLLAEEAGIDTAGVTGEEIDPIAESIFRAEAAGLAGEVSVVGEEGELVYEGYVTLADWLAAAGLEEPEPSDYGIYVAGRRCCWAMRSRRQTPHPGSRGCSLTACSRVSARCSASCRR